SVLDELGFVLSESQVSQPLTNVHWTASTPVPDAGSALSLLTRKPLATWTKLSTSEAGRSGTNQLRGRSHVRALGRKRRVRARAHVSHFAAMPYSKLTKPVTLPPGRARLSTKPERTGSPNTGDTIGTLRVACSNGHRGTMCQNDVWRERSQLCCVLVNSSGI